MAHTLESWRTWLIAGGYAERTIRARVEVVQLAAQRCGTDPARLTRDQVVGFLAGREYAVWSRRTYLQHLSAWAEWIGRPDLVDGIRRPPVPPSQPDPLPEEDLVVLLDRLTGERRVWVLLGAFAGFRASDVTRLEGPGVRPGELRIRGKGGRTDVLPVPPVLDEALRPYSNVAGRLWPVRPCWISEAVSTAAATHQVRMRFHRLRHRYGTAVYRQTRDLLLTQRLMRHSKPETTAMYAALVDDEARMAVHRLPGAHPGPGRHPTKE